MRLKRRCFETDPLLLLLWARLDRSSALEVGRPAEAVDSTASRTRGSRVVVLCAVEGFGLLLA